MRYDGTIQEADLAEDLMVDGEMYGCVNSICYLLMEMVEQILLLQLESEMVEVPRVFAISDIQSSPTGDERLSVSQLCQKQHDLWN